MKYFPADDSEVLGCDAVVEHSKFWIGHVPTSEDARPQEYIYFVRATINYVVVRYSSTHAQRELGGEDGLPWVVLRIKWVQGFDENESEPLFVAEVMNS